MNLLRVLPLPLCGFALAVVAACSGAPAPEPSSSSGEAIVSACLNRCDLDYTACSSFSDPCDCYPSYASCAHACHRAPAFDPPQSCAPPAPDAAPPPACNGVICSCNSVCYDTCRACKAACPTPGNPCQ